MNLGFKKEWELGAKRHMYAASLNINASMVLSGLTRAVDAALLFLSLSQDRDGACRAQGPGIVRPPVQL